MIVPGSANPLLMGVSTGYNLTRSLRFRNSASAYLSKNFGTTRTSGTTMTFSTWLKRGALGSTTYHIFGGFDGSSAATTGLAFSQDANADKITFQFGGSTGTLLATTAVYRDPSAWYHIVLAIDTTQATDTNRVKLYVNGSQVTSFSTTYYPSQNSTYQFLLGNANNSIGKFGNGGYNYFDGYMAETYCIDGQALTPSSFGQTSSTTGVWQPKAYTGTYGTNGFYLPFTDNSALTSGSNAGLGKDFSGNGNYWNTNNISITSGSTYDSMTDVPTLTSATAANFCTINPLIPNLQTITDGNLKVAYAAGAGSAIGSIAMTSGKYYWEITSLTASSNNQAVGIFNSLLVTTSYIGSNTNSWAYWNGGQKFTNASGTAYGASWTAGDVIGIAVDADAGSITFYKNNVSQGVAYTGLTSPFYAGHTCYTSSDSMAVNFGQRPFAYTPPTGYVALNTYNLPTPTIGATASSQANKYFDATTFTANGTTQTVTNAGGFQPAMLWQKIRNTTGGNYVVDAVRGASLVLTTNDTSADSSSPNFVTSLNSNGWSLGSNNYLNGSSVVGWQWAGNGSGSSNTSGSITSTVSANTTSGFSVVTYTGGGTGGLTVGHGLGVAPKMIIVKTRSTTNVWSVYHASLGNTKYMLLNNTDASATSSGFWNNTTPSSTVFTVGTDFAVNQGSQTYVAYCFAEIAGYSKFGSYTGNGSTDGTFIYTGFRPRYIMVKRTDAINDWVVWDTAESPYNQVNNYLEPNTSDAESTGTNDRNIDILSNGFKCRYTGNAINASGGTYIFAAFAEFPTKFALAR